MEPVTYWRLKYRLAESTIAQLQAEAHANRAAAISDAAWREAGVELTPNAKVAFDDKTCTLKVSE